MSVIHELCLCYEYEMTLMLMHVGGVQGPQHLMSSPARVAWQSTPNFAALPS